MALAKQFNAATGTLNSFTPGAGVADHVALHLETVDEAVEKVFATVARLAGVQLQPMAAFFGGLVAQELVKASGKFTPLTQWAHYHSFQSLPDTVPADTAMTGTRYDDQVRHPHLI